MQTAISATGAKSPTHRLDIRFQYSRISEEKVKSFTLALLVCILGAAPAPLVVGSVRDQVGVPVAGAVVSAGGTSTTTANDGTFALATSSQTIHVGCAYCSPLDLRVQPLEPVVVIVKRYQALITTGPTEHDLSALPYARSESAVAVAPFMVLSDSRSVLPGPRVSYLGASPQGSPVIDDGFTSYDPVANISQFSVVPFFDTRQVSVSEPGDSFYYGDQAGAGIVSIDDFGTQSLNQFAIGGHTSAFGSAHASATSSTSLAASTTAMDARLRGAAKLQLQSGANSFDFSMLGAQSSLGRNSSSISNSIEAIDAGFQRYGDTSLAANIAIDRAGYATTLGGAPLLARWSDLAASLRAETQKRIRTFADLGLATATGGYDVPTLRLAGTIAQAHLEGGFEEESTQYSLRAGAGAYTVEYNGGNSGFATPLRAQILSSFLTGSYHVNPQWSTSLYAGMSFRLPSLLETFARTPENGALRVDRYDQLTGELTYTDLRRLRIDLVAMGERLRDLDSGTLNSLGMAVSWQISPVLVLRAWTLHFADETLPYETLLRFGRTAASASPGNAWLTYENDSGLRFDILYRGDVLDGSLRRHLDASMSVPFEQRLKWFVGTEGRDGGRTVDAGLRFAAP